MDHPALIRAWILVDAKPSRRTAPPRGPPAREAPRSPPGRVGAGLPQRVHHVGWPGPRNLTAIDPQAAIVLHGPLHHVGPILSPRFMRPRLERLLPRQYQTHFIERKGFPERHRRDQMTVMDRIEG